MSSSTLPQNLTNIRYSLPVTHSPLPRPSPPPRMGDAAAADFAEEILEGLRRTPKRIPSKFFYDERGSKLFEEITALDEYYLTRTEIAIMRDNLPEIASLIGPHARIIEFGTGAGIKTRLLLGSLDRPATYIPIDISREQLIEASLQLMQEFPGLEVSPICADYTQDFALPESLNASRMMGHPGQTVIFFPGSTIGNFTPDEASDFLRNAREKLNADSAALLIGFDACKNRATLEAAYNDKQGLTAEFNCNLIARIAREAQVPLDVRDFEHVAYFNEDAPQADDRSSASDDRSSASARIEMHLVATRDIHFQLQGGDIDLTKGEHIITEFSYKYTDAQFDAILQCSGFRREHAWTDKRDYFRIWYCAAAAGMMGHPAKT